MDNIVSAIGGLIMVIAVVYLFIDLYHKQVKNDARADKLFGSLKETLDKLIQERELEKEKAKAELRNSIKEEFGLMPNTPEEDDDADTDEIVKHLPVGFGREEFPVVPYVSDLDEELADLPGKLNKSRIPEHLLELISEKPPVPEPRLTPEEYKETHPRRYTIDIADAVYFPCLDEDSLPFGVKVPFELVTELKEHFKMPDDNSCLPLYKDVKQYIKDNGISISVSYPEGDKGPSGVGMNSVGTPGAFSFIPSPKPSPEEQLKLKREALANTIGPSVRKLISYRDGQNIIFKECADIQLYISYVLKFGAALHDINHMPTGDQFIEWYNQSIDDYARLLEVEDMQGIKA